MARPTRAAIHGRSARRKAGPSSATNRTETDEFGKTLFSETADADRKVVDAVEAIAAARGVPMAQVALAWVLSKKVVSAPIIGASKPHHLDDAAGALEISLSDDEIARLEAPYIPHRVMGFK